MAKEPKKEAKEKLLEELTDEQQVLLSQAIKVLKQDIYDSVTSRLKAYLAIAATLITGFGILSFSNIIGDTKELAASKIVGDEKFRQELKESAWEKLTSNDKGPLQIKEKAEKLLEEVEKYKNVLI
jgi:hypothetical protein